MERLTTRVDQLSETVYGPSTFKTPTEFGARSWADVSRPPPRIDQPSWEVSDDEEEDQPGSGIVTLSEPDECLIQSAFSATIPSMERRSIRNAFPVTATIPQTKCPRLDPVFRSSLKGTEGVKALDKELSKAQSLVHDPVGPLAHFLARADEEDFSVDEAKSIIRDSLKLIGNALANISKMRRIHVLKALNPVLQEMADEPEAFLSAAPLLFGTGFKSKLKDRCELLRILSTVKIAKAPPLPEISFVCRATLLSPPPPKEQPELYNA